MMLTLHTETVIDSAHFLRGYEGKCSSWHGHSWLIEVWIMGDSSKKDKVGILFDFGHVNYIKEFLDHKLINEIPPFDKKNPTAENLSEWVYDLLKNTNPDLMFKVRLYETAVRKETWCECGDF